MWTDSVHISLTQLLDGPNYMALLGLIVHTRIFFNFFSSKFPSMTNFISGPIAAKIITLGGCFGYLWTAKDQNIYFGSSFSI